MHAYVFSRRGGRVLDHGERGQAAVERAHVAALDPPVLLLLQHTQNVARAETQLRGACASISSNCTRHEQRIEATTHEKQARLTVGGVVRGGTLEARVRVLDLGRSGNATAAATGAALQACTTHTSEHRSRAGWQQGTARPVPRADACRWCAAPARDASRSASCTARRRTACLREPATQQHWNAHMQAAELAAHGAGRTRVRRRGRRVVRRRLALNLVVLHTESTENGMSSAGRCDVRG